MYNNSKIIQGLMRLNDISVEELEDLLKFDLEPLIVLYKRMKHLILLIVLY